VNLKKKRKLDLAKKAFEDAVQKEKLEKELQKTATGIMAAAGSKISGTFRCCQNLISVLIIFVEIPINVVEMGH